MDFDKLARLGRDTAMFARANPLLMFALMPPWGLLPSVREWVADKIAEEELEQKLRAVVKAEDMPAMRDWIDTNLADRSESHERLGFSAPTRHEVTKAAYGYYIVTGEVPPS